MALVITNKPDPIQLDALKAKIAQLESQLKDAKALLQESENDQQEQAAAQYQAQVVNEQMDIKAAGRTRLGK